MQIPALCSLLLSVVFFTVVTDKPEKEYGNYLYEEEPPHLERKSQDSPTSSFLQIFSRKPILALSSVGLILYVIRSGLFDWGPLYLVEQKRFSQIRAGAVLSWFDIGGLLGKS